MIDTDNYYNVLGLLRRIRDAGTISQEHHQEIDSLLANEVEHDGVNVTIGLPRFKATPDIDVEDINNYLITVSVAGNTIVENVRPDDVEIW